MSDNIYCYPDSDVLINNLNIHDAEKLIEAERKLTMLRLMEDEISCCGRHGPIGKGKIRA